MRTKQFWGLLLLLQFQLSQAQLLNKKLPASFEKATLHQRLQQLQQLSGAHFAYDVSQMNGITVPGVTLQSSTLDKVLDTTLAPAGFNYTAVDNTIVIRKAPASQQKQPGAIKGRVVDFENATPLPGATVRVEGTSMGGATNEQGYFEIKGIPPGSYNLLFSFVGYQTGRLYRLKVTENKTTAADFKLQVNNRISEVVVTGIKRKAVANTTDAQLVNEIYSAKTVISGISNEQIARTLDRDAGEVVKRIPGVNISEDNFVIVRGLNKRYNLTYLNDAIAPATDADNRAFSYDVISSNAIDRIMVHKSPSPDLPGEFAGGVVKIYTRKSQLTRQVDMQVSTQYRPGSSFTDTWSYGGGKYDFLGFDDGTRKLPEGIPGATDFNRSTPDVNAKYSRQFRNNYVLDKSFHAGPDLRVNFNYYDTWRIGGKYLSNLSAISYTNTHEQRVVEQNLLDNYYDSRATQGIHTARISLIQSNDMKLNDHLSFELRNFLNINGQRIAVEEQRTLVDYPDEEFRHVNLYYQSNFMYSGQLSGQYLFGSNKQHYLTGNVSYSTIRKQEPDNRDYTFARNKTSPNAPWALSTDLVSFYMLSRYFTDVRENAYQGNIDLFYQLNKAVGLKAGVLQELRQRDFSNRSFMLNNGVNLYDPNFLIQASRYTQPSPGGGYLIVQEKYLPVYFRTEMFRDDGTGYRWEERTTPNNQYYAQSENTAGYLSTDINLLSNRLNIFGGARLEHNHFRILGAYEKGLATYPLVVDQQITSVLPSLNASFRPDSSLIIRAGYGKTLNRPAFREAAPVTYTNYLDQEIYQGNPGLTTVNIHNAELRLEWYPRSMLRNEMLNVGFFYKELDRPIERFRQVTSEGFDKYFYANTGRATVYGLEAEIRKSIAFLPGKFFRDLSVVLNGAWFKSNVKVPPLDIPGFRGPRERPLQGQSPYLLNASLNYENAATGTKVSVSYNRAGDNIYGVGSNKGEMSDADVIMKARDLMDITWRQRINETFSISAGVQNIFNAPVLLYQDWKNNYRYDPYTDSAPPPSQGNAFDKSDLVFRRYYPRPYYSLALNMVL